MNRDRYNPYNGRQQREPNCERCLAPLSSHFDGTRWTGCPAHPAEQPCGFLHCTATDIADRELWLCDEHRPRRTTGAKP